MPDWSNLIFSDSLAFEEKALRVFSYQFKENEVYHRFCAALGVDAKVSSLSEIPLLPINAFKDAGLSGNRGAEAELIFKSSGTAGMQRSRHLVADAAIYRQSVLQGFRHFYNPDKTSILAYVPGYSENPHSSLIWMLNELVDNDSSGLSRFLPLSRPLQQNDADQIAEAGRSIILFGAAFGLIDLVEQSTVSLPPDTIIIETGGMKTYKRAMSRKELHQRLARGFSLSESRIHSEYGMAELLSQAYARGGEWFRSVPWMRMSIRNSDNPMEEVPAFYEGLIGVIDLANVHSASFILTGDKGVMNKKGEVNILGRWNPKDLRGCNFLIDED